MQLLPGVTPSRPPLYIGSMKTRIVPGRTMFCGFEQLLAAPELARRDVILHARDHHRNDRPRLRDAGGLSHHSDLHDLALRSGQSPPTARAARRRRESGRRPDRIIGLTMSPGRSRNCSTRPSTPARMIGLVQIDLRFGERRLRAGLLRRKQRADAYHRGLLGSGCGIEGALAAGDSDLELFDVALRHDAGVTLAATRA